MNIGIIGCGHMGSGLAKAILNKRIGKILVGNPCRPRLNFKWTVDNTAVVKQVDIIILAVKPAVVQSVLSEIKTSLKSSQIIISIAAGISLEKLKKWSGGHGKIVRVMPNLPAMASCGVSVWKASSGLNLQDKKIIAKLLNSFGESIEVKNEDLINMATAVSGGGPAYTAAFLECMARSALASGFTAEEARKLALATVSGSINYIEKTGVGFRELCKAVQTKGGTTEAGFKILKKGKWQRILEQAFTAGCKKARQLNNY